MAAPTPIAEVPTQATKIYRVPPIALGIGTNNIVALVADKKIKVHAYKLHAGPAADSTHTFKDTTAATVVPTFSMIAGSKDGGPFNPYGLWTTAAGVGLDLLVAGATCVLEYLDFSYVD